MLKVKKLMAEGLDIPTAIKGALGMTVEAFADKYKLPRPSFSNAINGNVRATDAAIEALVTELGGTAEEWRWLLWEAGKPSQAAV